MPFWGLACDDLTLTYIATNPYNNAITFDREEGELRLAFTHEFTPFQTEKQYGFVIRLSGNDSPVESAKQFRDWLKEQSKFVGMSEKIKRIPRAKRLLGAAHVYLWGDEPFSRHDIPRSKWKAFCRKLIEQAQAEALSPGKRIKELMDPERWNKVVAISESQWPDNYTKTQVANELSRLLGRKDFFDADSWKQISLRGPVLQLLEKDRDTLSAAEMCRMNSLLLYAAFEQFMQPPDQWGNGVSVKMLRQLEEDGFDRMRLCVAGWEGVEKRPEVARVAEEMGYLFGTYDSCSIGTCTIQAGFSVGTARRGAASKASAENSHRSRRSRMWSSAFAGTCEMSPTAITSWTATLTAKSTTTTPLAIGPARPTTPAPAPIVCAGSVRPTRFPSAPREAAFSSRTLFTYRKESSARSSAGAIPI
jgi:hypothetical protein